MKTLAPALLLTCALQAQTPYLVKDINPITVANPASSSPRSFLRYGSGVIFVGTTPQSGTELWTTDGTAAGTVQVANINPGMASSSPSRLVIVDGKLVFNARDARGEELWVTDGTTAGTRLMADINAGASSSIPGDRIVYRGKLLFAASEPVNGRELWITDGTPAGTRFFKDLLPGTAGSEPRAFVILNDVVYFCADDAIWKTDGTEAGTVRVKSGVSTFTLTVAGSRMFFTGYTEATGAELWVSDGTEAGTHMVTDIQAGPDSSVPSFPLTVIGDRVLFVADDDKQHGAEPWVSDGTAAGTHMLRDFAPGEQNSVFSPSTAVLGGTAYLSIRTPLTGSELWRTDGTDAGTSLVRDIAPGPRDSGPFGFTVAGDRFYFAAAADSANSTLWVSDGTADGTKQVRTSAGWPLLSPRTEPHLTSIDGILYFAAANPLNGYEPWKSDGTDAGTVMITNVGTDQAPSSQPHALVPAADWVYFRAWDGLPNSQSARSDSLWRTDGTSAGTVKISEDPGDTYSTIGRSLFFSQRGTFVTADGTFPGTRSAADFASRFPGKPFVVFVLGDRVLATVSNELYGASLTSTAKAERLGEAGSGYIEVAGRVFYFRGSSFESSTTLYATDGTAAGTHTVASRLPGNRAGSVAVMDGHLYFVTEDLPDARLWKSDGTAEGTVVVRNVPGRSGEEMAVAGRNLFFSRGDRNGELWVTDGTETGTRMLAAKPASDLAAVGDRVFFSVFDPASGSEPWISDGTADGTRLLRELTPGPFSGGVSSLTPAAGVVYFTASDPLHGSELWVTDGTPEGTRAIDVEPGTGSSFPRDLTVAGDKLFFAATTSATGNELWALPFDPTPRLSIRDVRLVEGNSGSAVARFTITLSAASAQPVRVDYATSNGTALAGSDYAAATGTLTFNAGETSKTIDVQVLGDTMAEGNETLLVLLRNASGATVEKSSAFAIVEDDDRTADIALALDFSEFNAGGIVRVKALNHGPATATNVRGVPTETPVEDSSSTCAPCPVLLGQIPPGGSVPADQSRWRGFLQYNTMTVTARERDPNPANNSIGWTTHDHMALDALHLTPGAEGTVWFDPFGPTGSVSVESSNPSVVSVPSSLTLAPPFDPVSFVARGLAVGTARIRIFTPANTLGILDVDVIAPGTKRRWPGAIHVLSDDQTVRFDEEASLRIFVPATSPFTAKAPTGLVTITANGREAARVTLTADTRFFQVPYYLAELGANVVTVQYAGDDEFLPVTQTFNVTATRGAVTLEATPARTTTTASLRARVTGSPMAAPTGTITVSEAGVVLKTQALVATTPGVAEADIVLTGVPPGTHTYVLTYSGDTRYNATTQNVRVTEDRRRAVRP